MKLIYAHLVYFTRFVYLLIIFKLNENQEIKRIQRCLDEEKKCRNYFFTWIVTEPSKSAESGY